ncbi:MAG: M20/M25/M40 family metallo-hydrolase, partial [Bacteroidetes bacterium]|nr:M20/M25/M40 family metallo-hydrolase [Bacteroidota bacterium]
MKKYLLSLLTVLMLNLAYAEKLVLIQYQDLKELKNLVVDQALRINYVADDFIIATVPDDYNLNETLIDPDCWTGSQYYISWFHKGVKENYPLQVASLAEIVIETSDYMILKASPEAVIHPPVDGRIVKISNSEVKLPQSKFNYLKGSVKNDPDIEAMMDSVDMDLFVQNLQHLQDYGTRNAYTPQSVEAQNWIKQQFESYGYTVELFDFIMPGGSASDNVIATRLGTLYPDEYVVIGGHYDSYSFSGNAPGADDDGSGVCGVMEVARVMADFETDRTVLFCAWSGEEYGLYGSEAYATWCENQGLNILGYFNIDMCGYLNPGDPIHTDIIAPASAQPLEDFYTDVCALYLPDFIVGPGSLSGGDSDHTSFNNHGYMG